MTKWRAIQRQHVVPRHRHSSMLLSAVVLISSLVASAPTSSGQGRQRAESAESKVELRTQLVTCDVSVQDRSGRYVSGLERSSFALFEDNVRQEIAFFSTGDEPITIGIVLDVSGSMKRWFPGAIEALNRFAETCAPDDEFFVITFSDRPALFCDFTRDAGTAFNTLTLATPDGSTTLVDAAMLGLEKAQFGTHRRRALLVISDGQDNKSRYSFEELAERAAEADVLVYAIGIVDLLRRGPSGREEYDEAWRLSTGRTMLKKIAESSGGRAFLPHRREQLIEACIDIALELRSQYRLGYYPSRLQRDGRFHRLRVTVDQPRDGKRWKVRTRKGYHAPAPTPAPS